VVVDADDDDWGVGRAVPTPAEACVEHPVVQPPQGRETGEEPGRRGAGEPQPHPPPGRTGQEREDPHCGSPLLSVGAKSPARPTPGVGESGRRTPLQCNVTSTSLDPSTGTGRTRGTPTRG